MKKILPLIFLLISYCSYAQHLNITIEDIEKQTPIAVLTPGEKIFRDEAAVLYRRLLRILEGVPKKLYTLSELEQFADKRFTDSAFIQVKTANGIKDREPKIYFRNLLGRYFGASAKLDSTSEIQCKRITLHPDMVMIKGQRCFVCRFTQTTIDRKNGREVADADTTSKTVFIVFPMNSGSQKPSAKIASVLVDN